MEKQVEERERIVQELVDEHCERIKWDQIDCCFEFEDLGLLHKQEIMRDERFPHIFEGKDATIGFGDIVQVWNDDRMRFCEYYWGLSNGRDGKYVTVSWSDSDLRKTTSYTKHWSHIRFVARLGNSSEVFGGAFGPSPLVDFAKVFNSCSTCIHWWTLPNLSSYLAKRSGHSIEETEAGRCDHPSAPNKKYTLKLHQCDCDGYVAKVK